MDGVQQGNAILRQMGIEVVRQGIGIAVPAGSKLTIMQGDIVRMHVAFDYRGIAIPSCTLRCSIGEELAYLVFNELAMGQASVSLLESMDFLPYIFFADINTAAFPALGPGFYYIEAKIEEYPETLVRYTVYGQVIEVIGAPEFRDFAITSYEVPTV